jgi:hypothetical protein
MIRTLKITPIIARLRQIAPDPRNSPRSRIIPANNRIREAINITPRRNRLVGFIIRT